jgi:hypothetical protein
MTNYQLTNVAAQIFPYADRSAFLRAVAARFAGYSEIGDGEFARGLRELLHGGYFKPPAVAAQPHERSRHNKLTSAPPIA